MTTPTESQSALITHHAYDPDTRRMTLTFRKGGNVAHYDGVEPDVYAEFAAHDSHGKFFHTSIKNRFPTTPG